MARSEMKRFYSVHPVDVRSQRFGDLFHVGVHPPERRVLLDLVLVCDDGPVWVNRSVAALRSGLLRDIIGTHGCCGCPGFTFVHDAEMRIVLVGVRSSVLRKVFELACQGQTIIDSLKDEVEIRAVMKMLAMAIPLELTEDILAQLEDDEDDDGVGENSLSEDFDFKPIDPLLELAIRSENVEGTCGPNAPKNGRKEETDDIQGSSSKVLTSDRKKRGMPATTSDDNGGGRGEKRKRHDDEGTDCDDDNDVGEEIDEDEVGDDEGEMGDDKDDQATADKANQSNEFCPQCKLDLSGKITTAKMQHLVTHYKKLIVNKYLSQSTKICPICGLVRPHLDRHVGLSHGKLYELLSEEDRRQVKIWRKDCRKHLL